MADQQKMDTLAVTASLAKLSPEASEMERLSESVAQMVEYSESLDKVSAGTVWEREAIKGSEGLRVDAVHVCNRNMTAAAADSDGSFIIIPHVL